MNHAAEIARIAAASRATALRALAELAALRRRNEEAERAVIDRRHQPATPEAVDFDDEDAYYNPRSWLV